MHEIKYKYLKSEVGYVKPAGVYCGEDQGEIFNDLENNVASGKHSHAEGTGTEASGSYGSHAEGSGTIASGHYGSHAEGDGTEAYGKSSHAEGYITTASGSYSHAEGYITTASKKASHAEGYGSNASGDYSHAEGYQTKASGDYGPHAEGYYTTASGRSSHAEGHYTIASGYQSHAEGYYTKAAGHQSHAEGSNIDSSGNTLSNRKITLDDGSTVTIQGSTAYGRNSHAEGTQTYARGYSSHAEGNSTTASEDSSHSEGYHTTASGYASHAEGYHTTASGPWSHAEGSGTIASGEASHAEGVCTIASGEASHAECNNTTASGSYSHAEGFFAKALASNSHAEGNMTVAYGESSHAEGGISYNRQQYFELYISGQSGSTTFTYATWDQPIPIDLIGCLIKPYANNSNIAMITGIDTTNMTITVDQPLVFDDENIEYCYVDIYEAVAFGELSHSEGHNTIAYGYASHTEGVYTRANGEAQHVQGQYNLVDVEEDYAHIVGNGTDYGTRSNAHTLDWEGNAWFSGDVYVGSNSGTNKDAGSKKLATEDAISTHLTNYYTKSEAEKLHGDLEKYIDDEIADLVNSAPDKLNTLDELAAALGDDENFANTVTTSLSKKANITDLDNYIKYGAKLLTTNSFVNNNKLYISKIDNLLYAADKRFNVTINAYNKSDDSFYYDSSGQAYNLFDGNYEAGLGIAAGKYSIIRIDCGEEKQIAQYPYGHFLLSFFYSDIPEAVYYRRYCYSEDYGGIGWNAWTPVSLDSFISKENGQVYSIQTGSFKVSAYEFKIVAKDDTRALLAELEFAPSRPPAELTPFVGKYGPETLYYELTAPSFKGNLTGNADTATKATSDAQGNNIANTYQTKITGQEGQVVVINAQGQPVAQDVSLEPICVFDIDEDGALFSTSSLPTLPTAEEGEF